MCIDSQGQGREGPRTRTQGGDGRQACQDQGCPREETEPDPGEAEAAARRCCRRVEGIKTGGKIPVVYFDSIFFFFFFFFFSFDPVCFFLSSKLMFFLWVWGKNKKLICRFESGRLLHMCYSDQVGRETCSMETSGSDGRDRRWRMIWLCTPAQRFV